MTKKTRILIFFAAVIAGLFLYKIISPEKTVLDGNRFVIGMMQFPSNFHPAIDSMMAKQYVHGFVLRPLMAYNADWKKICMLCTVYPSFENGMVVRETYQDGEGQSKTGLAVTMILRDDIFWGDGTKFTAHDVLFGWQVGRDVRSGYANSALYQEDIRDVVVLADDTVVFHLSKDQCEISSIGDLSPLPKHLEQFVFENDADNYRNANSYDTDTLNAGLYNGPYVISHIRQGSQITLKPNPHWQGDPAPFATIELRLFENSAAMAANLLSGDIDYIAGELGLPVDQVLGLENRLARDFDILYKPGLFYEHIDVSRAHPALQNDKVRQALMYGMNRDEINQTLFGGKMTIAHSNVNPLDIVYYDDVLKYEFNFEKANELLDAAGYPRGADGRRDIQLRLMTTAGNRSRELVQQALQDAWGKLGIQVEIRNQPARTLFGETLTRMKFDSLALFAWISSPQSAPRTTLHSSMIPKEENAWSGQNYTQYINPRMDQLIDDLNLVCQDPQRQNIWNEMQKIYADELPALPLFHRAETYLIPKWLEGLTPTGHRFPSSLWVTDWRVKEN